MAMYMRNVALLIYLCTLFICIHVLNAQQSGNIPESEKNKDDARFSIGLGTLSPSYTQKLAEDGKLKLEFNPEKGSYTYSLSNHHPIHTALSKSYDKVEAKSSSPERKEATSTPIAPTVSSNSNNQANYNQLPDMNSYNNIMPINPQQALMQMYLQRMQAIQAMSGMNGLSPYGIGGINPYLQYRGLFSGASPFFGPTPFAGSQAVSASHGNLQTASQTQQATTSSQGQQPGQQPVAQFGNPYLGQLGAYGQLIQRYGQPYSGLYGSASTSYPTSISNMYPAVSGLSGISGISGISGLSGLSGISPYAGGLGATPYSYLGPDALNAIRQMYSSGSENYMSYLSPFTSGTGVQTARERLAELANLQSLRVGPFNLIGGGSGGGFGSGGLGGGITSGLGSSFGLGGLSRLFG